MSDKPDGGFANEMSLRTWLAGQALPAIIAGGVEAVKGGRDGLTPASIASDSFKIADAMLAAMEKDAT